MGEARRLAWVADGKPWRPMRPVDQLARTLRGHGYTVYTLGDERHLEHDPPEDHTPYSATGWPGTARYGVVYAGDIMPPPAGAGLPSLQQLGRRLVDDRNAGVPGIRWLKYINWEPERNYGGDCWHDSWQPGFARRASGDRGHIHVSGLTGYEDSTSGDGYDPVARNMGEDMPTADEIAAAVWSHQFGSRSLDVAARPAADWLKGILSAERKLDGLALAVAQLASDEPDPAAFAAAILPGLLDQLTPEAIAAALPATVAQQLADLLAARLQA